MRTAGKGDRMLRLLAAGSLTMFAGCADRTTGAALNECRMNNYLDVPGIQETRIPDCMRAKSFQVLADCHPAPDPYEWDPQVSNHTYNDPRCYRSPDWTDRVATALSPL